MKVIRDAVHGSIPLSDFEISLIDTPQFQRLRKITQLGFTYLAYPGATHTRFDHGLGTLAMADRMVEVVGGEKEPLKTAALLHDVGHSPFSHDLAGLLERYTGKVHEDLTYEIILEEPIAGLLEKQGLAPKEIAMLAAGRGSGWRQMIITGKEGSYLRSCVDADILDYMVRDAQATGVAYGIIDVDRLVDNLLVVDGKLVLHEKARFAVESLLMARYIMMPAVYRHRVAAIAEAMISRALDVLFEDKKLEPAEVWRMDEVDLISLLRHETGYAGEITKRLEQRNLLKLASQGMVIPNQVATTISIEAAKRWIKIRNTPKLKSLEQELARKWKIPEGFLMIDIYPEPKRDFYSPPFESILLYDGKRTRAIEKISPIAASIGHMDWAHWYVAIYVPAENRNLQISKKFFEEFSKSL